MPLNPMDLSGRTILVTGASSGIGRDAAILLSQLGARLAISGRNIARLSETRGQLEGSGHREFPFDMSNADQIPDWIKSLTAEMGPLSGIVHSAGVHAVTTARAMSAQRISDALRANVTSALMLVRGLCQRDCYRPGASVVLISSVMGVAGAPSLAVYSTTKAALIGMTRSLAAELARDNIRVNCVAPGVVTTEMTARFEESLMPEAFDAIRRMHPLGLGAPRDVSHAIAFLLADTGRWITGSTLIVDGGYTAQ